MRKITYLKGDATCPIGVGHKIIAHVCNDKGKWGKGFVLAVSKKWPEVEHAYRTLCDSYLNQNKSVPLGILQLCDVDVDTTEERCSVTYDKLTIANMVAQHDIYPINGVAPIRYSVVEHCLYYLSQHILANRDKNSNDIASVHMPRIGCGLAGGTWNMIEPIIVKTLSTNNINVFIYDLW